MYRLVSENAFIRDWLRDGRALAAEWSCFADLSAGALGG